MVAWDRLSVCWEGGGWGGMGERYREVQGKQNSLHPKILHNDSSKSRINSRQIFTLQRYEQQGYDKIIGEHLTSICLYTQVFYWAIVLTYTCTTRNSRIPYILPQCHPYTDSTDSTAPNLFCQLIVPFFIIITWIIN